MITDDQAARLIEAVNNVCDLVNDDSFVETIIELFSGSADELKKEETMSPRGRKKKDTAVVAVPTTFTVPQDRIELITEWKTASDQLKELKAKEQALRQALVAQCFDGTKLEGSERLDVGWGMQLHVTKEIYYNAANGEQETETLINLLSQRGATELAEGLVTRWEPNISKSIYRKVLEAAQQHEDAEILQALHKAITLSPGMPQLELVPAAPSTEAPPAYQVENVPA